MKNKLSQCVASAITLLLSTSVTYAFKIDTPDPNLKIRWDNTFKYSSLYRVSDPDKTPLTSSSDPLFGTGNLNFDSGIASNRLDWVSEFDIRTDSWGARISAEAWYDDVYFDMNDNDTGFTNNLSASPNEFTRGAQEAVGRNTRIQDAFIYIKGDLPGGMPARVNFGRHTVIYGETLINGSNGIANAQGPVDIIKAASVPAAKVKEFLLPTHQLSGNIQFSRKLFLDAYYQFEWEESPFFASGSFLSPADFIADDSESFISAPFGGAVPRAGDLQPNESGQWGFQLRYRPDWFLGVLGVFAANYHDKLMTAAYYDPVANTYARVFQKDIKVYGLSFSTVWGESSVSFETSIRDDQPLVGGTASVQVIPGLIGFFDNSNNPAYALGKTAHATAVAINVINPNAFFRDGGSLVFQYDFHTVLDISKNETNIDPTTSASAHQLTTLLQADYFNVLSGLDISIPMAITFSTGRSRVYPAWVEDGGTFDLGVKGIYQSVWDVSFNYRNYFGVHEGTKVGDGEFDQTLWDRDFLSLSVQRAL